MLTLIGISITLLLAVIGYYYATSNKIKPYFSVVWKNVKKIKARELLWERPYDKNYFHRDEDELIEKNIEEKNNVLIIGLPLDGKTRAVFELLNRLKRTEILIPRFVDIKIENYLFPKPWHLFKKKLVLIDDIHRYVDLQNFDHLFKIIIEKNIQVIATCRSGIEFKKVNSKFQDKNLNLSSVFNKIIEIKNIDVETGKVIAKNSQIDWAKVKFNKTIGSIFMQLTEMKKRYDECNDYEKTILQGIKKLFICGILDEKHDYELENIKAICKTDGLELKEYEWLQHLKTLQEKQLILFNKNIIQCEEVYIENIIDLLGYTNDNKLFHEQISLFINNGDALVKIGLRAFDKGFHIIKNEEWMNIAIIAYEEALRLYTYELFPTQYGSIQDYIGRALIYLTNFDLSSKNCKRAIKAFQEALTVFTNESFPQEHGIIQINLGNAYKILAGQEGRTENCKRAIKAYEESLRVNTYESFPIEYSVTQSNVAEAYTLLSEVESRAKNCRRAINACEEAMRVLTYKSFLYDYGNAQNNLGKAYCSLAEFESKSENCTNAIKAYEESLRVNTYELSPVEYGKTQSNLANAYSLLSHLESKSENCKKALKACEESLRVFSFNFIPTQYGIAQNNLGNTHAILSDVESKSENCRAAIKAYEEALRVFTYNSFPLQYAMVQNSLGNVYMSLSEVESKRENCKRAITAYKKAIKVFNPDEYPEIYHRVKENYDAVILFSKEN
ncbi:MAG: tetratricopeptide repeat protein [Melioribacter sp.]|nr:tetratricopeptide repeat protein [Melioribacter sp.]